MLQGVTTKRPCQLPLPWLQAQAHAPGPAWPRSRPASSGSSSAVAPMAGSAGDCWPWPWPCSHGPLCSWQLARIQGLKPGRCPHSPTPVMADGHDFGQIAMLLVKSMIQVQSTHKRHGRQQAILLQSPQSAQENPYHSHLHRQGHRQQARHILPACKHLCPVQGLTCN